MQAIRLRRWLDSNLGPEFLSLSCICSNSVSILRIRNQLCVLQRYRCIFFTSGTQESDHIFLLALPGYFERCRTCCRFDSRISAEFQQIPDSLHGTCLHRMPQCCTLSHTWPETFSGGDLVDIDSEREDVSDDFDLIWTPGAGSGCSTPEC